MPSDAGGSPLVTRLLGLGLMVSVIGLAAYAFNLWSGSMMGATTAFVPEPGPRGVPKRPVVQPEPAQPVAGSAAGQVQPEQPQPTAKTAAAESVPTAEEIARKRQRDLEIAEQDRRRSEQIEADFAARARKRARANVSITMYSTSWCPSCKAAREYMTQEGILFTEHDIDSSESARTIMRRLNPRGSIPTIDIDGAVLVGFSSRAIEDTIDAAVKKRAGG